jgi:predicted phage tail protein
MADIAKNLFKVVLGILLMIVAIWFAAWKNDWGQATLSLIKGGIVLLVVLIGFVLLLVGFSDLKNAE